MNQRERSPWFTGLSRLCRRRRRVEGGEGRATRPAARTRRSPAAFGRLRSPSTTASSAAPVENVWSGRRSNAHWTCVRECGKLCQMLLRQQRQLMVGGVGRAGVCGGATRNILECLVYSESTFSFIGEKISKFTESCTCTVPRVRSLRLTAICWCRSWHVRCSWARAARFRNMCLLCAVMPCHIVVHQSVFAVHRERLLLSSFPFLFLSFFFLSLHPTL